MNLSSFPNSCAIKIIRIQFDISDTLRLKFIPILSLTNKKIFVLFYFYKLI